MMIERVVSVSAYGTNCWLVACPVTGKAVLIDAGDDADEIIKMIKAAPEVGGKKLQFLYLFHTHSHFDHIGATRSVREFLAGIQETPPQIVLHPGDEPMYWRLKEQGDLYGISYDAPLKIDRYFEEGQEWPVGKLKFNVINTPGHSPGSVCLLLAADAELNIPATLYSGDTLFHRMIGVSDFWDGNREQLVNSIEDRIFSLDDSVRLCPGHGRISTIGAERRENTLKECQVYPIRYDEPEPPLSWIDVYTAKTSDPARSEGSDKP